MVDDDHDATDGVADGVRGAHIRGHVFVFAFRPDEAAVERVERDDGGVDALGRLRADGGDQRLVVFDQVQRREH